MGSCESKAKINMKTKKSLRDAQIERAKMNMKTEDSFPFNYGDAYIEQKKINMKKKELKENGHTCIWEFQSFLQN